MGAKLSKEEKKELRRKKVTISKVMTPVVMTLFVFLLLLLMNLHSLTHFFNREEYQSVKATVVEETKDSFAMVIPMVTVYYQYGETTYEDKKLFVLQPLFGLSSQKGDELTIYVNQKAPNHFIFKENFFANGVNWLLLVFEGVFISLFVRRCRRIYLNHKEKRYAKKGLTEKPLEEETTEPTEKDKDWQMERRESDDQN